jgi:DNA adenine methylase
VPTLLSPTYPRRPPLKWAGGKRWLVPKLQELWSAVACDSSAGILGTPRLVEPFVGGMAVALGLQPNTALLNDANQHVINFYQCLQQGLTNSLLMLNDAEQYAEYRSAFNQLTVDREQLLAGDDLLPTLNSPRAASLVLEDTSSKTQALLFYYLNRTGFNGLCRFNNKGEFNVPFGRYKTITYSTDFLEYQELLGRWHFSCGDFAKISLRDDDFIYADPPYDRVFTKYSQQDFTWDDQERLAEWLSRHSGKVVVSNQATDRIIALYEKLGFRTETIEAPRRIACNGNRKSALEMLAYRGF